MKRHRAVRRTTAAALVAAAATIGACGSNDYPASVRKNFLQACETRGGKAKVCECTLSKIENKMDLEEFRRQDRAIRGGAKPSPDITDAIAECR